MVAIGLRRRLANQREADASVHQSEPAVLSGTWDRTAYAMEARILRPLLWFGLLEYRREKMDENRDGALHGYRKSALFDRLLAFSVAIDRPIWRSH